MSRANAEINVESSPTEAYGVFLEVLNSKGYTVSDHEDSDLNSLSVVFYCKRTMFLYVARTGAARFTESDDGGTLIELGIDVSEGQPVGLMDGKRNRKLLEDLVLEIKSRL